MATDEKQRTPKAPAKECEETFSRAADLLDLSESEREEFMRKAMIRAGCKPTVHWTDPDDEKEEGHQRSGGWFPSS